MESRPASSMTPAQLAQLFNSCFEGYVGSAVAFDGDSLVQWCERHFVSLGLSHVFFDPAAGDDEPVAFGLIAEREDRPGHSRLGAMGVAMKAQGKGIGTRVLPMIVASERERGVEVLELECIQSNPRAMALYKGIGFEEMRELAGWEREAVPADSDEYRDDEALEEVTVDEVEALIQKDAAADLPWQQWFVSKLSMAKRAFRLGHAWCVISDPDDAETDKIKVATVIVEAEWRGQGEGTRLARAMLGRFKGKKWDSPVIMPKEFGDGLARRARAMANEVKQVQMRLRLQ